MKNNVAREYTWVYLSKYEWRMEYVCTAMRSVVLCGMELKLGMGVGDSSGPRGWRAYSRSDPTQGQKSSKGQVALEMPYGHHIW